MDNEQRSRTDGDVIDFSYPSPAEIERLMARGRALRAQTMTELAKATVKALRRAFGHPSPATNPGTGELHPHTR